MAPILLKGGNTKNINFTREEERGSVLLTTNASRPGIPPPTAILFILEDVRTEFRFYAYVCFGLVIYLRNTEGHYLSDSLHIAQLTQSGN